MLCCQPFLPGNSTTDVFLGTENCFKNAATEPEIWPEVPRTSLSGFTLAWLCDEPPSIPRSSSPQVFRRSQMGFLLTSLCSIVSWTVWSKCLSLRISKQVLKHPNVSDLRPEWHQKQQQQRKSPVWSFWSVYLWPYRRVTPTHSPP